MSGNPMFDPSTWLPKRQPQRSRRSWVVARGDAVMEDDVFARHPESQQVVAMDPGLFLRLTLPDGYEYDEWLSMKKIRSLERRLDRDLDLDPAWLEVDIAQGNRVIRHEGRHRAAAALRLGLSTIPVVIYAIRGAAYVDLARNPGARVDPDRLLSQKYDEWQ